MKFCKGNCMKTSEIIRSFAMAIAFAATSAMADTWYVSPDGDNGAAGTESAPFRTIQHAVGRANVNDTVVLLPGDYGADQGTTNTTVSGNSSANRVVVDKPLTIIGRDGRDKTRIVGAWDTTEYTDLPWGFGPNAVRCVWIDSTASRTRLEGITFYKGSVPAFASSSGGNTYGGGGGVLVNANDTTATIVDCAFIDCQAFNGGGLCHSQQSANVKAVRCLFKRCRSSKFGTAMRGGSAYNCVFDDNGRTRFKNGEQKVVGAQMGNGGTEGAMSYPQYVVNCTFVNNDNYAIGTVVTTMRIYNCIFANNGYVNASTGVKTARAFSTSATYANCVSDISTITANNCTNVAFTTSSEVYSPFDGDYRLVSGARSLTYGSATYLDNIPEEFRDTDFCGNARTTDDAVYCGAVQDVADAAASGVAIGFTADGDWYLDGEKLEIRTRTWKAEEGWPKPRHVKFVPVDGKALVRFSIGGVNTWPLRDDSAWFTSSKAGQVQTVAATTTSNIFYADPVNGSDDTGDGSEANPYRTLNKAVKKTTVNFVVRALPGDYCTATEEYGGEKNRVVVPDTLEGNLRVVAVGGPENTFITGASDPSNDSNGTGANAVRCIAVASTNAHCAAFQGFTLRDGRTGPNDTVPSMGAAIYNIDNAYNNFNTAFLLDSVVTNCSGNRGGCVAGGNAYRCKFYDCKSFNGGGQCLLRYCSVVSSLFVGCGGKSQLFGNTAKGYNCTIWGSVGDVPQSVYNGSNAKGYLYNSVSGKPSGNDIHGDTVDDQLVYTLYCRMDTNPNTFTTAVKEDPLKLLDATSGDYRLAFDSAGLYLASTSYMMSCMDLNGNPFLFDGTSYQAGCYAARVGGVLYVDAANGSDANDGLSEETAFQTLASAMSAADYGDTLVALPGIYDTGTMVPTLAQSCYTTAPTLPARVVVKKGVTLESRDGADTTIIKGSASPSTSRSDGCGDGAVRGVFLCDGATLRGFTVTGGRTLYNSTSSTIDTMGGGVCGAYSATDGDASQYRGLVDNCIISNNAARTGGGAQYGTYRNCRFFGNSVYNNMGYALCRGLAEGCVFKGNGPGNGHSVCYNCKVVNCTLFGGQAGASSSNRGLVFNEGSTDLAKGLTILNSIVLGNYQARAVTNCYFLTGAVNTLTVNLSGTAPKESGIVTGSASVIDEDGKPVAGAAVIDTGMNDICPAALAAGLDLAGTRRILNSAIDIGAREYDWGKPWGNAIGGRRLAIDDMPSDAALGQDGKSLVFGAPAIGEAGVPVAMTWTGNGNGAAYDFTAIVTGAGTLVVTANGAEIATITAADGAKALKFTSALDSNSLLFAYDGAEADGVTLSGFSNQAPFVLMVR